MLSTLRRMVSLCEMGNMIINKIKKKKKQQEKRFNVKTEKKNPTQPERPEAYRYSAKYYKFIFPRTSSF